LVHKSDPNFADKIRHVRDPKKRMAVVWGHCKGKMVCEADDPKEDGDVQDGDEPVKKGHGGCGHHQPLIRKEGLKLFVQYKKSKDDDEVGILSLRRRISRYMFIHRTLRPTNPISDYS
jgi:DNA-directed RNA polymerase II subunit RPB1